ncbi:MAG: biopolymer transporter ExbD [Verrucomicrobia bacterium]|nr:biopolymer transporter ExbD [Verrucomicrobiota bacterium]
MHFFIRKRRGTPTVIIVALIDILIVMLIFLMVTTTFKQQPALRLALPESSQARRSGASESVPLIVSIDAEGNLRLGPNDRPLTADQLRAELAARAEKDPDLNLAINADKAAPIGQLVKVMDAVKEANIKPPSMFTREAGNP